MACPGSYNSPVLLQRYNFKKNFVALWGLNIRNSLGRLYLSSNGTAKDLLHFVLAHLGGFYSQINSTRLLLNTNDIL